MSKVSYPSLLLVALVAAAIAFLIGTMPQDEGRSRNVYETSKGPTRPQWIPATTDDQERWVVMLGEVELRIPQAMRSNPPAAAYDWFSTSLCLREDDVQGGSRCHKRSDRILIYLHAQPFQDWPPECNAARNYTDRMLRGPFVTAHPDVELYRSASGATRKHIYRMPDEQCLHPTAACSWRCLTHFRLRPGVMLRYEFPPDTIHNWPTIHRRVLEHVTPLLDWQ